MLKSTHAVIGLIGLGILYSTSALADVTVNVTLSDMNGSSLDLSKSMGLGIGQKGDMSKAMLHVALDKPEVAAGKVTFHVTNGAKELAHEMLVIPLKDANTPLPYVDGENRADEDAAGTLGEVAELEPGKSGDASFNLKPGLYGLICNVPGHYAAGMWTVLAVK